MNEALGLVLTQEQLAATERLAAVAAALAAPLSKPLVDTWYCDSPKQFFFNAFQNNRWPHPTYLVTWCPERRLHLCDVTLPIEVVRIAFFFKECPEARSKMQIWTIESTNESSLSL
jgi:hypothetical protein